MDRWLILGAGNIAHRFCESLSKTSTGRVVALAGRRQEKLVAFARELQLEEARLELDFDVALEKDDVDAVYIALPHTYHYEWIKKALLAGKAVLSEKPAVLYPEQIEEMHELALEKKLLFMEGMKNRFCPAYKAFFEKAKEGEFGGLKAIDCRQRLPFDMSRNPYLTDPEMGGVLYDVGIYAASCFVDARDWQAPESSNLPQIKGLKADFQFGADSLCDARFSYAGLDCHYVLEATDPTEGDFENYFCLKFEGADVSLKIIQRPESYEVKQGESTELVEVPYEINDFSGEIIAFSEALRAGELEVAAMTHKNSYDMCSFINQLRRSTYENRN